MNFTGMLKDGTLKNKTILITGSAGTIGSELLRLCFKNGAKKIIAIDHNEYGQYKILEKHYKNVLVSVVSVLNKSLIEDAVPACVLLFALFSVEVCHLASANKTPSSVV